MRMITGIRVLIFLAIFAGSCYVTSYGLKVKVENSLFMTAAIDICLLFVAGVVGILWPVTLGLYALGSIGFLMLIYRLLTGKESWRKYCAAGIMFAVSGFVIAFIMTYGKMLVHCDNFTHWAVIAKSMIGRRALPDISTAVSFRAYPPATAIWIYYVSKVIGFNEGNMMWAQRVLEIAACTTVFGLIPKEMSNKSKVAWNGLLCLVCVSAWGLIGYEFYSLLVDVTVPMIAGAVTVMMFQANDADSQLAWGVLPGLTVLCLTKNSGFIFWIFVLLFWIWKQRKIDKMVLAMAVLPVLAFGVWLMYVKHAYPADANATVTNHAMTLENWMRVLSGKTWQDIALISKNFFVRTFSLNNTTTLIYIVFNLVAIVLMFLRKWKSFVKSVWKNDVLLVLYMASLLGMYIFSMEGEDAIQLASYDRYYASVLIYALFVYAYGLIRDVVFGDAKADWKTAIVPCALMVVLMLVVNVPKQFFYDVNSDMCVLRQKVQEELGETQYLPGVQIVTYTTWNEGVWLGNVVGYELSNYFNENWLVLPEESELEQRLAEKQYVLIIDENIPDSLMKLGLTESGFYRKENNIWVQQ